MSATAQTSPASVDPAFEESLRGFVRARFASNLLERARSDHFPRQALRELGQFGLTALLLPDHVGGQDADLPALGAACEEAAYADPIIGYLVFGSNLAATIIHTYGTSAAIDAWLPGLVAGEQIVSLALTEPEHGSDAAAITTRASRVAGGWLLSGEKTSVTQGPHADAAIVFAKADTDERRDGVTAFLVPLDDRTVSRQRFDDPGFRCLGRGALSFNRTFVPDSGVLGVPGSGFRMAMHEFDLTRTLIALLVTGTAQRALDMTCQYVRERKTFGRPLATNQGVSFPIAEHTTYLTAVRALARHALALRAAGQPHTAEAAMLKWWAPEVAFNAIKDCIVLHGHVGWSDELPLQSMLRDVSGYLIGDGTPQIQKMIIARHVLGRDVIGR